MVFFEAGALERGTGEAISFVLDPAGVEAPALCALRAHWEERRAGRLMPRRADISPWELRDHLRQIFMLDVLPDGDFRFRLIGTEITRTFGRDSTGKTVREVYGATAPARCADLIRLFRAVVETRRPVLSRSVLVGVRKEHVAYEAILMPLAEDGVSVNILVGAMRFILRPNGRLPSEPLRGGGHG
jgi:hypothetical protein